MMMVRRGALLPMVSCVVLSISLAGCSGDEGGSGGDGDSSSGDGDGDGALEEGGTITVDGTTYEVTNVLDCTIGNEGAPDDRQFVGESDDGTVRLSVSFYGEENEFGLNGVGLDTEVDGNDWTWASSYAGADAEFSATLTDDGAEGTATLGVVGIDSPEGEFTATWSFTCVDDRG